MNDKDIIQNKNKKYRYTQREITLVKNEKYVKWYNAFLLEDQETLETTISEFTDFFYHKKNLNKSINTKKNNYGNTLLMFLNYVFFDREDSIECIEDITVDMGNEFINAYSEGKIGRKGIKANDTIEKTEGTLTSFYYWLNNQSKYKMKYISKGMFKEKMVRYRRNTANREILEEKLVLDSLFTVEYHNKKQEAVLKKPSENLVYTFIELAKQYDPIMAFPIALGAFAGMRRGEICQMTKERIFNCKPFGTSISFCIDLQEEYILRGDGKRTGAIKRPRIQLVYEAFLPYLDKLYKSHLLLLIKNGFNNNVFGALVIDENGNAMTTKTYADRFQSLVIKLIDRIGNMANNNNYQAALDYSVILNYKMKPHSMRYFFSQYIAKREPTHILAMYRGDLNLNTALTYLKESNQRVEYIHKLQDSFEKAYEDITGESLN